MYYLHTHSHTHTHTLTHTNKYTVNNISTFTLLKYVLHLYSIPIVFL